MAYGPGVPAGVLTWLGHATFRLDTPAGKRVYVDPWLECPTCPESERDPERVDLILLTHGHGDHVGQTPELWQRFRPRVIAQGELRAWLSTVGVDDDPASGPNKGGNVVVDGITITLTDANHSSSGADGAYTGEPCGLIVKLEDDKAIYFAGDTNVFGGMELIGRLYTPDVAILPIGDFYTMGPREAALALELVGSKRVLPCHFGTFPILTGTVHEFRKHVGGGVEVHALEPGESVEV
jgi:L-ascorbate metabolism protein UlaG (beta-lactamase superfamily)